MEFDHLLLMNFIPILGTIVLIIVICITVVQQLKVRWPVKVNCWFCHKDTKIWRQESDWWLCPSCEQYNGFSKDGDYMYDIPEQYNSSPTKFSKPCLVNYEQERFDNALCDRCNAHESKKIIKLANYVAKNERKYDTEIERYRTRLESQYSLCTNCQLNLNNVLIKQSKWLMQYKMLIFKDKPVFNTAWCKRPISRIVVIIINCLSLYYPTVWQLLVGGLLFQTSVYMKQGRKWNSDILSIMLWIYFISTNCDLISTHNPILMIFIWLTTPTFPVILILKIIIALLNVELKFCSISLKPKVSLKKLENTSKNASFDQVVMNNVPICDTFEVELTHSFSKSEKHVNKHTSEKPNENLEHPSGTTNLLTNRSLMDSMNALNTLSLNDDASTKEEIDINHLGLFGRSSNKRNILSSLKSKSVASSSWIAGGYWQKGMGVTSLSRSSSQSSGFGSVNSNFVPSREPSVRDIDKSSVDSDISQTYSNRNANTMSSQTNPFFLSPAQDSVRNRFLLPQQTLRDNFQCYENIVVDHNLHGEKLDKNKFFKTKPLVFSFATVIMSPTWWPVLLGSSILLNVILLGTLIFH